jgi:hypothetical protein
MYTTCYNYTHTQKGVGGTGIRARVKRITTAYANHYTIPPVLGHQTHTQKEKCTAGETRTRAIKDDYDLNVAP